AVALHPGADQVDTRPRHVVDAARLRGVPRLDAGDPGEELSAVAAAGPVAERPRLEQRDAPLRDAAREVPRRRGAGGPAGDHRDVDGAAAVERGQRLARRRLVEPAGAVLVQPVYACGRVATHPGSSVTPQSSRVRLCLKDLYQQDIVEMIERE